jgi:hypothetical protein
VRVGVKKETLATTIVKDMGPVRRRMLHEALDLVLDAFLAEEPKPARKRVEKVREMPQVDELTRKRAERAGRDAGLL